MSYIRLNKQCSCDYNSPKNLLINCGKQQNILIFVLQRDVLRANITTQRRNSAGRAVMDRISRERALSPASPALEDKLLELLKQFPLPSAETIVHQV